LAEGLDEIVLRRGPAAVVRVQLALVDLAVGEPELQLAHQHLPDERGVVGSGHGADNSLTLLFELAVETLQVVGVGIDGVEFVRQILRGDRHAVGRYDGRVRLLSASEAERAAAKDEDEGPFHERSRLAAAGSAPGSGGNS
jgi:hypothetical protein